MIMPTEIKAGDFVKILPVYLENKEPGHSKFYMVCWIGPNEFRRQWGRIGTDGSTQVNKHHNFKSAGEDFLSIIDEKIRKGYKPAPVPTRLIPKTCDPHLVLTVSYHDVVVLDPAGSRVRVTRNSVQPIEMS